MKKILLGSLVLLIFSAAIILFQISCTKPAYAHGGSQESGLLYFRFDENAGQVELWAMQLNGNNDHKVNFTLPEGWILQNYSTARFSSNSGKIIFTAFSETDFVYHYAFFTCNPNGSNLVKIKEGPAQTQLKIEDLYEPCGND